AGRRRHRREGRRPRGQRDQQLALFRAHAGAGGHGREARAERRQDRRDHRRPTDQVTPSGRLARAAGTSLAAAGRVLANDERLRGRVLEGHAELAGLREPWQELFERCPSATPFQSPEWLLPWANHHRPSRPWAVVIHDRREQLIGLAPMFLYRRGGPRALALLGAGASDYGHVLALPGRQA